METEIKMARRLAAREFAKGTTILVGDKEYDVTNGTLEEVEAMYPDFKIIYFGNFVSVSKV